MRKVRKISRLVVLSAPPARTLVLIVLLGFLSCEDTGKGDGTLQAPYRLGVRGGGGSSISWHTLEFLPRRPPFPGRRTSSYLSWPRIKNVTVVRGGVHDDLGSEYKLEEFIVRTGKYGYELYLCFPGSQVPKEAKRIELDAVIQVEDLYFHIKDTLVRDGKGYWQSKKNE